MTENALSIFQCSFRKKYSTQHALIAMIEKAKKKPSIKAENLALF